MSQPNYLLFGVQTIEFEWARKGPASALGSTDRGYGPLATVESRQVDTRIVTAQTVAQPTSVYLYYDKRDLLIYVGVTSRGIARNREHNGSKVWWQFVVRQDVEHFSTRAEALKRERELIIKNEPPFNVQQNPSAYVLAEAYLRFAEAEKIFPNAETVIKGVRRKLPLTLEAVFPALNETSFISEPEAFRLTRVLRMVGHVPAMSYRKAGRLTAIEHEGYVARFIVKGQWVLEASAAFAQIKTYPKGGITVEKIMLVTPSSSAQSFGVS